MVKDFTALKPTRRLMTHDGAGLTESQHSAFFEVRAPTVEMACRAPEQYNHQFADVNGFRMHYVQEGDPRNPAVVLCHGFPDLWYGWRYQIDALKESYHVIVPDLRGYGESMMEEDKEESDRNLQLFSMRNLTIDLAHLLDHLGIAKAYFLGHDWGGALVYRMAMYRPNRVLGIASVCTPYDPPRKEFIPVEKIVEKHPAFAYQLFFMNQRHDANEAMMKNPENYFSLIFQPPNPALEKNKRALIEGLMKGPGPDMKLLPSLLSKEELQYYCSQYAKTGLYGGLNWYRTRTINWENEKDKDPILHQDVLYIGAALDPVLSPDLSLHMDKFLPNLVRSPVLSNSNHWALITEPKTLNTILLNWLAERTKVHCPSL